MLQPAPFTPDEFSDLIREHQAGLRAFVRALGVETDWVDDIAQEAFVVAYRRRKHFDDQKEFGRWLRGIARNLVANERRKHARQARILAGPLTDQLLAENSAEPPADTAEIGRLTQAMNECVGQLAERSRDLLRQRYEGGHNATTLAGHFGMSAEAIRQSLGRIRAAVKQCIESKLART